MIYVGTLSQPLDFPRKRYEKILKDSDIEKLKLDLNRLGEWAVENTMKVNPGKSKAVSFTRARVNDSLSYF